MADSHRILIIEDEAPLRQALAEKLRKSSYEVLEAEDGQKGLDTALQKKPDLILLDWKMPVKDGGQTLKELRSDEWGADVPVIILTNLDQVEQINAAVEQNADYLVKSDWTLGEVIKLINSKL